MDDLRRLESSIYNFGGMGTKEVINPSKWLKLPLIDKFDVLLPIKTKEEAISIFKDIINS